MGLHATADTQMMETGDGVEDADALVVGLLDFFCAGSHVTVEVDAQRHVERESVIVGFVAQAEAKGPGGMAQRTAGGLVEVAHPVGIGAIADVGADA